MQTDWDHVVQKHLSKIKSHKKYDLIAHNTTYESFRTSVETSTASFGRSKIVHILHRLGPAVEHLQVFSNAIGTSAQAQANPLCLIWGSLQVIVTVCGIEVFAIALY